MRLFLLVLLWSWPLLMSAQELFMKVFDHRNGLPTNTIYDMVSSRKGYIYLATDYGIYSFNGRDFKPVPLFECKATTFTDLCFDYKGRLWTRNFSNEIFCLERDTLRLMTQYFSDNSDALSVSRLLAADHSIYINDQLNIRRLDLKTMQVSAVVRAADFEQASGSLWDFAIDSSGNIYMKSDRNLWVKPKGRGIVAFEAGLTTDLKTGEGHFGYDFGEVHYTPILEKEINVYSIYAPQEYRNRRETLAVPTKGLRGIKLSPTSIWFCSAMGLYLYEETGELTMVLPKEYYTTKIVQDFEGGYWIATIGQGLIYMPNLNTRWVRMPNRDFTILTSQDKKTILVGSNQGDILAVDTSGQVSFRYTPSQPIDIQFIFFDSLRQRVYHSLGYHEKELSLSPSYSPLSKNLMRLDNRNMILGAHNGAYIINEDIDKSVTLSTTTTNRLDSVILDWNGNFNNKFALLLRYGRVRATCKGANQYFFMAFVDGLYVFDIQTLTKKTITTDLGRPIYATSLASAGDTLWVGTFQQGIFAISQSSNKIIAHYTTKQGLNHNQSNKIVIAENKLWILSAQGIDLLDTKTGLIENASRKYTLDMTAINDVLPMGRYLWLSTNEGLLRMDNINGQASNLPRIIIHDVKYGNTSFNPYPQNNIILGQNGEQIQITFEAISFRNRQNLSYEYRLLELSPTWQSIDAIEQQITLPIFPSGNYTLQLRVKEANLNLRYPQYQFKFQTYPSFIQRDEFIGLVVILIGIFIWFITYIYYTYYSDWHSLRVQVIISQLTSLRARMNPHFLNNTLNTIQALVKVNNTKLALRSIEQFSTLMRTVLNVSAEENTSLAKELEALQSYMELERLRFNQNLQYTINLDLPPNLKPDYLLLPAMILQPIVENAIKHGLMHKLGKKEISINCFASDKENLFIIITDNGVGRKASIKINSRRQKKYVSFATEAINTRIELINKLRKMDIKLETIDRYDSNDQPSGTTVILSIPIDF